MIEVLSFFLGSFNSQPVRQFSLKKEKGWANDTDLPWPQLLHIANLKLKKKWQMERKNLTTQVSLLGGRSC